MSTLSRETLAAYLAIDKTISAVATKSGQTIGDIVDEVVLEVEQACRDGRLGIEIWAFERDPDDM